MKQWKKIEREQNLFSLPDSSTDSHFTDNSNNFSQLHIFILQATTGHQQNKQINLSRNHCIIFWLPKRETNAKNYAHPFYAQCWPFYENAWTYFPGNNKMGLAGWYAGLHSWNCSKIIRNIDLNKKEASCSSNSSI